MKNLLQKSLKPLTIFAFIVFALSIPIYFLLVDWIWQKELDENNELIAQRIENEFNEQGISEEKLTESIRFWNEIQSVGKMEPVSNPLLKDSLYTIRRQNPYSKEKAIDRFRGLKTPIKINENHFILTIETNVEESEETMGYIAVVTLGFFLVLIIGFWLLNKWISVKLWEPFRKTLTKLKTFNLNNQTTIEFEKSDTVEFEELNEALQKLIEHSISVYKNQKEFTENASHELQTPLAIIKSKLDLLLQEVVTDRQYQIIEEINKSLTRITRINRNLLLLAKIENRQFQDVQNFYLSEIIRNSINNLEDFILDKNIQINSDFSENPTVNSNQVLTEILVDNLLLNAIRYAENGSAISLKLSHNKLIISNTGDQILDKKLLFERFKKRSDSTGSGLGLSIVKGICINNGWQIDYNFKNGFHSFSVIF